MRAFTPLLLSAGSLSALDIQIDYSLDDNNFFNTQERRDAIEAVAQFYGDLLQDNLLRIDSSEFPSNFFWVPSIFHPATGAFTSLDELVIPEDTIIVFVGSRNLRGNRRGEAGPGGFSNARGDEEWFDLLFGRGQAGAEFRFEQANQRTDIGLWGGVISFDSDTTWNFSLTENQPGFEFVNVALHEMAHVLGIGVSDPWTNLVY